jgi:cytochrome P450/deferrochelatase/peroxidase EfeB
MAKAKYFDGIAAAQARESSGPLLKPKPFDFDSLAPKGALAKFTSGLTTGLLGPLYSISRRFMPLMPLAGLLHVTRDAQVREILLRPDDFITPFGPEMKQLGGGATFVLGLQGEEHDRQHAIVSAIIRREDGTRIADMSGRFASALLANSGGRIDIVEDLVKRVPAEICLRYFGLRCEDIGAFGDWTMALSAFLFGDPYGKQETREIALDAGQRICAVIDEALARTRIVLVRGQLKVGEGDTLIERLALMESAGQVSESEIAILMGLATGFIPTNTLAATRMLEILMQRPEALAMARRAAAENDLEAMRRIGLEAGRLNPALAPGQWRYAPHDTTLEIDGKHRPIKAGTTLLVSTMSAMRDGRAVKQPKRFWPDRTGPDGTWQEPDLLFGIGPHVCIGKHLAIEQITALFMVLMKQPGLRAVKGKTGKLQSVGPFPRHWQMEFDTPSSTQSMFIVLTPVQSGATQYAVDAMLKPFGNPASAEARAALDATGIVHFCSLATILSDSRLDVAWELTVDGEQDAALEALARHAGEMLRPIFEQCGLKSDEDIAAFWKRHIVELHGKPWGANGLNYNGLPEFPISTTDKQARLADLAERALSNFVASEALRGSHAMLAMDHVRRIIGQDPILRKTGTKAQRALMDEAADKGFDALRLKPGASSLQLADFRDISGWTSFSAFLKSRDGLILTVPSVALFALFYWLFATADPSPGLIWKWIGPALKALLSASFVIIAFFAIFFALIRRAEKKDWIDPSQASMAHLSAINAQEGAPGYAQNHILAVGEMKPGFLRAFAHAFALWAIRIIIVFNYRPGFVINMGTIHFARWWRVPGTNKTAFYSNFDGSWENYLEDFITRARLGQSAAWSNWVGFPETRYLVFKGAEQGDDFKRWVRTKQQVVPFWYSRFPALTTDRIRTNALIHQGLASAKTHSEAEEWLRCFGSMPKVENLIESDEVQAIVFTGLKQLPHSATLVMRLPQGQLLGEWLSWIRGERQSLDNPAAVANSDMTGGLSKSGVIVPVYAGDGSIEGYSLAHSLTLTFGDRPLVGDASIYEMPPTALDASDDIGDDASHPLRFGEADAKRAARRAIFLGLSSKGMGAFAQKGESEDVGLLSGFPSAFRMGMANRGRNLGDQGKDDAHNWRWSDATAEAVLFVYSETPEDLAYSCDVHSALVQNYGGTVLHRLDCAPANPEKPDFEHFGYRDGIAQPVIKGTGRATRGAPARDILEPGEFILGYANGQGFFPPSPIMAAESDPERALPVLSANMLSRYPDFGDRKFGDAARDLGRNGSFVVIRELAQDVDGFEKFVEQKAAELRGETEAPDGARYRELYKLIGQYPDKQWVKAKLMGRWPNGRPLVGNPVNTPSPAAHDPDAAKCFAAETENDFSFGAEDPHGYACPFAAHIRRANPRDSKQPGDPKEQLITNRHRLLRRGRAYLRPDAIGGVEKGLLFVSLCADLERQFEFVQQIWSNSADFHGLSHEPDPISGSDAPDLQTGCPADRNFTIPTPAGPIKLRNMQSFVQVKAGGYFFLPSRSALTWMTGNALASPTLRK